MMKRSGFMFLGLFVSYSTNAMQDEFGSGQMRLISSDSSANSAALMLHAEADIEVTAMTAKVSIKQTFKNTAEAWVHGNYVFPLPEDAAVNAFSFRIGERLIEGQIQEKVAAKKQFQQAKKAGKQAALVAENRPNLFRLSLANIPPEATISAELVYWQTVAYKAGVFSLRLPTTLTPRYIPGRPVDDQASDQANDKVLQLHQPQDGWAFDTDQVTDASQITPPQQHANGLLDSPQTNQIHIQAWINAGFELAKIHSPSHQIVWRKQQAQWSVALDQKTVAMNRDFILSWAPQLGHELVAAVFAEDQVGGSYVSLMLMPPQAGKDHAETSLPRDVIFVIDSSGSMAGQSMRQAKRSLQYALSRLKTSDGFELIDFNHETRALFGAVRPVNKHTVGQAMQFVARLEADGGTEMASAIELALADRLSNQPGNQSGNDDQQNRLRQVVFITDGSVGNEQALFALIQRHIGQSRLFTVGIGSAPNSYFMRKAAQFGRGSYTYVAAIDELEQKMSSLFQQLEQPMLRDIQIRWPDTIQAEAFPTSLPDLYAGQPLLIKARLGQVAGQAMDHAAGQIEITGLLRNRRWSRTLELPVKAQHQGIATLWARAKIEQLMDELYKDTPEADIKPQVLSLALQQSLLSRYTSFVAIDSQPVRPNEAGVKEQNVVNLMPAGSSMPWPNTATSARLSLYLSLPFLLMSLMLWRRWRDA